jgi:hypothetical protein
MIQTLMNPLKIKESIHCQSGESRARCEALALSSNFKSFWTPAPVPDPDPGFAGVTGIETYCDLVKIGPPEADWSLGFIWNLVLEVWDLTNFNLEKKVLLIQSELNKVHMRQTWAQMHE